MVHSTPVKGEAQVHACELFEMQHGKKKSFWKVVVPTIAIEYHIPRKPNTLEEERIVLDAAAAGEDYPLLQTVSTHFNLKYSWPWRLFEIHLGSQTVRTQNLNRILHGLFTALDKVDLVRDKSDLVREIAVTLLGKGFLRDIVADLEGEVSNV